MGFVFFLGRVRQDRAHKCQSYLGSSTRSHCGEIRERVTECPRETTFPDMQRGGDARPSEATRSRIILRTTTPGVPRGSSPEGPGSGTGWGLRLRCLKPWGNGELEAECRRWGRLGGGVLGLLGSWGLSTRSRYRSPPSHRTSDRLWPGTFSSDLEKIPSQSRHMCQLSKWMLSGRNDPHSFLNGGSLPQLNLPLSAGNGNRPGGGTRPRRP